jgi:fatty acid desaturase
MYTLIVGTLPFLIASLDFGVLTWLIMLPLHAWLIVNVQNSSLHHNAHWKTFSNKALGKIYDLCVSAVSNLSNAQYRHHHLSHHIHVNDRPVDGVCKDPVSVFAKSKNGEPENFWIHCSSGAVNMVKSTFTSIFLPVYQSKTLDGLQVRREKWVMFLYVMSVILCDLKYGLWYTFVLLFVAHFMNRATSYGEHWQVLDRRGDTTQDSIGIYSRWYNIIGFGAGYHQEHHHKPGVHWTRLHEVTPLLHPDRKILGSMHITNCPFWQHFKDLFVKQPS